MGLKPMKVGGAALARRSSRTAVLYPLLLRWDRFELNPDEHDFLSRTIAAMTIDDGDCLRRRQQRMRQARWTCALQREHLTQEMVVALVLRERGNLAYLAGQWEFPTDEIVQFAEDSLMADIETSTVAVLEEMLANRPPDGFAAGALDRLRHLRESDCGHLPRAAALRVLQSHASVDESRSIRAEAEHRISSKAHVRGLTGIRVGAYARAADQHRAFCHALGHDFDRLTLEQQKARIGHLLENARRWRPMPPKSGFDAGAFEKRVQRLKRDHPVAVLFVLGPGEGSKSGTG
jgi:hypothetical protein